MERRILLKAAAAMLIVGCEAKKPTPDISPSRTLSSERLQELKAYINQRKEALLPGFYGWLQEVEPNMPLTLDETMSAFILVGSFKEWESTVGTNPTVPISVGVIEPKVYVNVEKISRPKDKVSRPKVDALLIQGAAILLSRKVDQPNQNLITVDRSGNSVKATGVFVKGFAMYGYVGLDKVSEYRNLDGATAIVMVHQYLSDLYKGNVILDESDLPADQLLWAAKLNNDLKARNIDPKLVRYWHIESDLVRLAGAFGGASNLVSPPQEAIQRGLDYLKREYGNQS